MPQKKTYIKRAIIALLLVTLFILPLWVNKYFGHMDFMQVMFLAMSDAQGGTIDPVLVFQYFLYAGPLYFVVICLFVFYYRISKDNYLYTTKVFKKGSTYNLHIQLTKRRIGILVTAVLFFALYSFNKQLRVIDFFTNTTRHSDLYDKYYVNPENVDLVFPDKKRNLIYIVLESMEVGYHDIKVDGEDVNLIPNLEALSKKHTHFKEDASFTGAIQLKGTSWTVASLVGQTTGVPIQISKLDVGYGEKTGFMPGIIGLGEILEDQGYHNYFMAGSDANFGGRETYFKTHGNYTILDTKHYKETGKIPQDYEVFWGFEDKKLFRYAQEELLEISKNDEPFNFTMLTVDTHFNEGYTDEYCEAPYESAYANAIHCSDEKITKFINWIQAQDFYKNTTIVLIGDHFTMNQTFADQFNGVERYIYNVMINPKFKHYDASKTEHRDFSVLDFFPTTLSSLGVDIPGEQLGLGVNLMSDKKTLLESMGRKKLEEAIVRKSVYYNKNFLMIEDDE